MHRSLTPWVRRVRRQHHEVNRLLNVGPTPFFRVSYVSLSDVAGEGAAPGPTAEDVRQYLRRRFTSRPATTERPRYLAIAALPYPAYGDPTEPVQLPAIPRFRVAVRDVDPASSEIETDVPYGFLAPETMDGGDGFDESAGYRHADRDIHGVPDSPRADLGRTALRESIERLRGCAVP